MAYDSNSHHVGCMNVIEMRVARLELGREAAEVLETYVNLPRLGIG